MNVREGGVSLSIPEQADEGIGDDVFFNPRMELNRDLTIAVLRAYREQNPNAATYLDATAATGARGVRAAADGWDVTCCDRDPDAAALCEENLARNDLDGEVVSRDVNALLHESAFDVVDIDPFGSPIPFTDAAVAGTRNLLCVTATDTAPLCGAHFQSGIRRYGAVPRNTDYHAEIGLRVLISALVRIAAQRDVGVEPILSHSTDHYHRTYLTLSRRASDANAAIDELGYVHDCEDCPHRESAHGLIATPPDECSNCGSTRLLNAGPLWLGTTRDPTFVASVREAVDDEMGSARRAHRLLETIEGQLDEPTHYDQHRLCKAWGRSASSMDDFLSALREAGIETTRTHFGGTTFETPATVEEIRSATEHLGE